MAANSIMAIKKKRDLIHFPLLFLFFFIPITAYLWIYIRGGNTLLFEDGLLQSFPFRAFLHNAFAHGFSPQWVPNSAYGFSLLAEGQNGICFPFTQIIYRLFSAETGWMLELLLCRLLSFVLCWNYLKNLGTNRISSFLGASVYTFSGATFGMEGVPAILWCYTLLPGLFSICDRFIEKRPFSFILLIVFFTFLFLTGHPVMIIYIGMMFFIYFLFQIVNFGKVSFEFMSIGKLFFLLLISVLASILIASPQLIPMFQMLPFSARTVETSAPIDVLQNTLHLQPNWIILSLFPTPFYRGEGLGLWSGCVRFPIYALFLCFIGIFSGGWKNRHRGFFLFLGIFSILMALGPYVGLWKLVHSLPVLDHFRFPFRWLFFLPICISFFSARGFDLILKYFENHPPLYYFRIIQITITLVFATGAVFIYRHRAAVLEFTRKAIVTSPWLSGLLWLCTVGTFFAIYLSLSKKSHKLGLVLGVALTVISLTATLSFNIQDPTTIRNLASIGWKGDIPQNGPQEYRTSSDFSPYDVFLSNTMQQRHGYTPNLTVLNGTLSTGYYFSFFPYWSCNVSNWSQEALEGNQKKRIFLNLSAAKWLFMKDQTSSPPFNLPKIIYENAVAYNNIDAIPRASVVSSYRKFSDEKDLANFLMSSDDFNDRQEIAVLEKDAKDWDIQAQNPEHNNIKRIPEAKIVSDRPDRIEIELEYPVPVGTFLLLADTYYPGWRAFADGNEEKIVRSDYAFRGIPLPEGTKHVVFFYDPIIPDLILPFPTILLLCIMAVLIFIRFFNRKKKDCHVE